MAQYCDLHTHSVFSDGTYTPAQTIDKAISLGLSAVALTDHDSIDGLQGFLEAAKGKPIQAVAGIEFAVVHEGTELHLLGLFLPTNAFPQIGDLMQQVQQRREDRVYDLVASLNRAGYTLDFGAIKADAKGQVTRAHVAAAIEQQGYMAATTAFRTLLKPGAGHYTSPQRLPFLPTLELIRSVNAVPVLAHPLLNMSPSELKKFLPQAKKWGLAGMECIYSAYDDQAIANSFALAESCGLQPSGGSDFHGDIRPEAPLGNPRHPIPYEFCQTLESC